MPALGCRAVLEFAGRDPHDLPMLEESSSIDGALSDPAADEALDAYSKAVVGAVELVGPAVVSIYVEIGRAHV